MMASCREMCEAEQFEPSDMAFGRLPVYQLKTRSISWPWLIINVVEVSDRI